MLVKYRASLGKLASSGYKDSMRKKAKKVRPPIGQRLFDARERLGLVQQEAAKLAGFPGDESSRQSRLSHYELGERSVTLEDLVSLAKVYGVNPEILAFGDVSLPEDEEKLLQNYRISSPKTQGIVRGILETELQEIKASRKGRSRAS